mgnify:CR=1 FL=1
MTAQTLAILTGVVVPLLVAAVTRIDAPPAVKAIVNALLSAVAAWLANVIPGTPLSWKTAITTIGIAWASSVVAYFGLWKPTGVEGKVANATKGFGVGGTA